MRLVDYKSAAEAARTLINDWTATQTHDRIPEILAEGVIDAMTRLVLVNAIYLKAPWEEPFDTHSTAKRPFRTDDGKTVQADTMSLGLSSSGYARGDDWEAVRILYAGGALAMTVVLPAEGRLDQVSAAVADGGLTEILAANRPTMVQLSLPKWEFRTQAALADVLKAMGMPTAFDPNAADFSAHDRAGAAVHLRRGARGVHRGRRGRHRGRRRDGRGDGRDLHAAVPGRSSWTARSSS